MEGFLRFINRSFGTYQIKGIYIEPTYWQAFAIIILLFLLVFTLARLRYIYVEWHFSRQNFSFMFYGFLLALILEGFLVISGRTFLTSLVGWKNAPKPISTVLDSGRAKLVEVLGEQTSVPNSLASESPTIQSVVSGYESLSEEDAQEAEAAICKPR